MKDDLSQYKDLFITESNDRIQNLNNLLLEYEKSPQKETLNSLMREAHTLKGMAATMEYSKMAFLCHVLEDIFDYARYGLLNLKEKKDLFNELFDAFDVLGKSLKKIEKDNIEGDCSVISKKLKECSGVKTEGTGPSLRIAGKPIVEPDKPENKKEINKNTDSQEDNTVNTLVNEFTPEKIENIRIKVDIVDNLMSITEELIISKLKIEKIIKTENWENLPKIYGPLETLINELQREVMKARLVPINFSFQRFARMVRDLAEKEGKKVNLEIEGGDIEFDRSVVEEIGVPLVHLLRNAVDHGIVKSGVVKIKAQRLQNYALVEVSDDGVGIDLEEIKKTAIKKGIISLDDVKNIKEQQVMSLIFNPQFSTSKNISSISGRGVGLSVVKNSVEAFRGSVQVKSEKGKGTTFILKFPLTLAITKAMIVKISQKLFAVSVSDVYRIITLVSKDLKKIANEITFILDKEDVLILFPQEIFYGEEVNLENEMDVLALKSGEEKFALKIDEILGEQEIVVKPIPPHFKNKYVSGVTVLEDGQIVPILNISGFLST